MKMSKLDFITIVLVGILLFALGFLIFQTMNLMNDDGTDNAEVVAPPPSNDEVSDADIAAYDIENQNIDNNGQDNDAATTTTTTDDEYPIADDAIEDAQDLGKDNEEKEGPVDGTVDIDNAKVADESKTAISNKSGEYLVMGGSFRQRINADNMVKKLQQLGFDDAAVFLFNRGAYAVAVVDRYDSWSKANTAKKELESQGVEVFIMKKK